MANIIKTKFSAVTAQPTSLAVGELAYSDQSDTLWIGDNTGTPVAIGGAAAFTKLAGIEAGAQVNTVNSVAGKTGTVTLVIGDVANLQTTLDGKAASVHGHVISDVTGLQTALDGKAAVGHSHAISDVTGLQTALDNKADDSDLANYLAKSGGTMTGFITLHADPTAANHAATKQYVDNMALGLDFKQSVRVATTANINPLNVSTIDGISLQIGDRVLVKNQSNAEENGLYVVITTDVLQRAPDADTSAEVTRGMFVFVEMGATNGGKAFVATEANVLGTDPVVFTQFGGGQTYTAGTGLVLTGNEFSLGNHSADLLTSGTIDVARLPSAVLLDTETIDGGSF